MEYNLHVLKEQAQARQYLINETKAHLRGLTEQEIHAVYMDVLKEKAQERGHHHERCA